MFCQPLLAHLHSDWNGQKNLKLRVEREDSLEFSLVSYKVSQLMYKWQRYGQGKSWKQCILGNVFFHTLLKMSDSQAVGL